MILLLVTLSFSLTTQATIHNFLELGALPNDLSDVAAWHNGRLLNDTLAALKPGLSSLPLSLEREISESISGDTLLLPNMTFHVMGGIFAKDLESVVLQVFPIWGLLKILWSFTFVCSPSFILRLMAPWSFLTTWTIGREWKMVATLFLSLFFTLFELKFYFWVEDCDLFFYTFFVRIGKQWPLFFL